jgi:hypothetical protein
LKVRIAAYQTVPEFSKKKPSLVRRNVDILVQLLQNGWYHGPLIGLHLTDALIEEPNELRKIKNALLQHYDTDPFATCQVLLDSCMSSPNATEDERAHRGHLRELVISFLLEQETIRKTLLLHVLRSDHASEQVIDGLLKVIFAMAVPEFG